MFCVRPAVAECLEMTPGNLYIGSQVTWFLSTEDDQIYSVVPLKVTPNLPQNYPEVEINFSNMHHNILHNVLTVVPSIIVFPTLRPIG